MKQFSRLIQGAFVILSIPLAQVHAQADLPCGEGEVAYELSYDGLDGYPEEFSWHVLTPDGTEIASGEGDGVWTICAPAETCLQWVFQDSYGDGFSGGGTAVIADSEGNTLHTATEDWGSEELFSTCSAGCSDETAVNYDPDAVFDDGSCSYCSEEEIVIAYDAGAEDPDDFSWTVYNENDEPVAVGAGEGEWIVCKPAGACWAIHLEDASGLGFYFGGVATVEITGLPTYTLSGPWSGGVTIGSTCPGIAGCMNPEAINFNPEAEVTSADCIFADCAVGETPIVISYDGQNDPTDMFDEFSWEVVDESGAAVASGGGVGDHVVCVPTGGCYDVYLYDAQGNGLSNFLYGSATVLVRYGSEILGTVNNDLQVWSSAFRVNTCGELGCADEAASNFNPEAVVDDGSCVFCEASLLTVAYDGLDGDAESFSFQVVDAEGNVVGEGAQEGTHVVCLAESQCYNVILRDANGDGSFFQLLPFSEPELGTVVISIDGEELAAFSGNWGYEAVANTCGLVSGCTDAAATNFDAAAEFDDGSCCFGDVLSIVHDGGNGPSQATSFSWELFHGESGELLAEGVGQNSWDICLPADGGCHELVLMRDEFGMSDPYAGEATLTVSLNGEVLNAWVGNEFETERLEYSSCGFLGCTDAEASNFDPQAESDDGSCCYEQHYELSYEGPGWQWAVVDGAFLSYVSSFDWTVTDADGQVFLSGSGPGPHTFCAPADACFLFTFENNSERDQYDIFDEVSIRVNGELVASIWPQEFADSPLEVSLCQFGCTDPAAVNYDSEAVFDDGSCAGSACASGETSLVLAYIGADGFPEEFSWSYAVDGMELESGTGLTNFGTCFVDGDCPVLTFSDAYGDGVEGLTLLVAGEEIALPEWSADLVYNTCEGIVGCMDADAVNFNPAAESMDETTCIYAAECAEGEQPLIFSYDGDDGFPEEIAWSIAVGEEELASGFGASYFETCVASDACPVVTIDDSYGDGAANVLFTLGELSVDLSGEFDQITYTACAVESAGCTDATALNFDATATEDDGTCEYPIIACSAGGSFCYGSGLSVPIGVESPDGTPLLLTFASGMLEGDGYDGILVRDGFGEDANVLLDDMGDGSGPIDLTELYIISPTGRLYVSILADESIDCEDGSIDPVEWAVSCVVEGCTEGTALNFDEGANVDDGSCVVPACYDPSACNFAGIPAFNEIVLIAFGEDACDYSCRGCMEDGACNYDAMASIDDGSCVFVEGDLDQDGVVSATDLLLFLARFTSSCGN